MKTKWQLEQLVRITRRMLIPVFHQQLRCWPCGVVCRHPMNKVHNLHKCSHARRALTLHGNRLLLPGLHHGGKYLPDTYVHAQCLCLYMTQCECCHVSGPVWVYVPVTHLIVFRTANVKCKGLSTAACNVGLEMRLWEQNQVDKSVVQPTYQSSYGVTDSYLHTITTKWHLIANIPTHTNSIIMESTAISLLAVSWSQCNVT